jgi:outer membrane protein TolC
MHSIPIGIGRARLSAFVPLVVVLAAALSAAPSASAQAAAPYALTPDAAVEIALKNNLSLASERLDAAAKKRKADTAWNVFIPQTEVSGTLSRWNLEKSGVGVMAAPPFMYSYELPAWNASGQLSVQLVLNAALFEGMRNLKLDYEAGLISREQAELRLERDVRKSYLSILLLKENVSLMEETIAAAERRAALAQSNYRSGLAPELSVLQARVAAENLRPQLEELRNAYDATVGGFALSLGLPRGATLAFAEVEPPDFAVLDADALVGGAASGRIEHRGLRKSLELLESAKKLTFQQLYTPTLILGWTYDPAFSGDPMKDSWFAEDWEQSNGMFRATLSFKLNGLLPFTSDGQKRTEADERIESLRYALEQTVRGTETEIDTAVRKLAKSQRTVEALDLNVSLAERSYRLTEEAYRAGATDLLEVQNAELELRKARVEVLKERFNYLSGLLDLEYAAGLPFGSLGGKK